MNRPFSIKSKNKAAWIWRVIWIRFYDSSIFYNRFYYVWRKTAFRHTLKNMS